MKTKTLHRLFTAVLTGTLLFGGTQLVFANELEDIQNAGVIKVGVEGTYQPYTYHDEDGNLIINEEESKTVRLIFFMYLYGYSTGQIAEQLNILQRPTKLNNITFWRFRCRYKILTFNSLI